MNVTDRGEPLATTHVDPQRLLKRGELYTAALICLTIGALSAVVATGDRQPIMEAFARADVWLVAGLLALSMVHLFLRAFRFQWSARRLGLNASLPSMALLYIAGLSMTATPGKLGEVIRLWLLKRRFGFGYQRGLPLMIADRAVDVLAILALCLAGLGAFTEHIVVVGLGAAILVAGTVVLARPRLLLALLGMSYRVVGRKPRLFVMLRRTVCATAVLFRPDTLMVLLAIGVIGWLAECTGVYWTLAELTTGTSFQAAMFIFSFALLLGNVTFLPGGIGATEVSMVALLTASDIPVELAIAVTVLVRLCTLWFAVGCGFVALLFALRSLRRRERDLAGSVA